MTGPLTPTELRALDAYWRAANYLSVGQIYLLDNPLLREPLRIEHIKPRLLGPLGHDAGAELRLRAPEPGDPRARPERDLRRRARPRRALAWSRTSTSRAPTARSTPTSASDEEGLRRLFRQFSFPGGIPSHVAPETPGSIHEGGELGYSLAARLRRRRSTTPTCSSAAWSATARRRPGRWPRAGTRTSSSNPARDGAVLPVLHLNGYKIANPTVLARIPHERAALAARGLRLRAPLRRGRRTRRRCTS